MTSILLARCCRNCLVSINGEMLLLKLQRSSPYW